MYHHSFIVSNFKHNIMKQLAIIFLSCFILQTAAVAQFYNSLSRPLTYESGSASIALGDGFVFAFTLIDYYNNQESILLVKTSTDGNILWSKRYDADANASVKLTDMIRTYDNEILIAGETSLDRCLVKIKPNGKISWAKKYAAGTFIFSKGLVQLKDSSFVLANNDSRAHSNILHIDANGNVLEKVKLKNKYNAYINSITAKGNTADFILQNFYISPSTNVASFNFKTLSAVWQREYITSNQFTALLSSRCKNGDIIYLAGRTSGGTLNGTSRVFRTDANGNLLWAKNISAKFDKSGNIFSIFDIVSQIYIHEDVSGNIVALVQAEGTNNLMIVLDASGNYLYNHYMNTPENFLTELSNGSYLNTSSSVYNFDIPHISNRFLSASIPCDSTIFVTVTNGVDSAATLAPIVFSIDTASALDLSITASNANITRSVYCSLASKPITTNAPMQVDILPNPCTGIITVKTKTDVPFSVYNMSGTLMLQSSTNRATDVSKLTPGLYMIEIKNKNSIERRTIIKQ